MRYDAAIIGAGADGLAAAATLAKSGLKVILLERSESLGGRCTTREFHPGFRASPFCDELPPIPAEIFWALDLAKRGVVFAPAPAISALWPDRVCSARDMPRLRSGAELAAAACERAAGETKQDDNTRWRFPWSQSALKAPWPGDDFASRSLSDLLSAEAIDDDQAALTLAQATAGRALHPEHAGSALHLLIAGRSGSVVGGLHRFADGLSAIARDAGAEISCGLEATDIRHAEGRVRGVMLADGTEIAARAVISTLDLKRTFLWLFAWNDLPKPMAGRVANFRMAGSTARLLFALNGLPDRPAFAADNMFGGDVHIAPSPADLADAYAAWRGGTLNERLPIALRFQTDPQLCPLGAAVMTATVSCVPARMFDGAWAHEKRDALRERVLARIESVLPGTKARVLACEVIVPPDIEEALGCTDGDLWGGEIAADQMLGMRPWLDQQGARTAIGGMYLAGRSTAAGVLGTCVGGVLAAQTLAFDLKTGRLK